VHFFRQNEEWTVKSTTKILFEDHGLTTGMLICTKKEMKIAKWLYPDSKFAVSW
jgi:hypothetical protein